MTHLSNSLDISSMVAVVRAMTAATAWRYLAVLTAACCRCSAVALAFGAFLESTTGAMAENRAENVAGGKSCERAEVLVGDEGMMAWLRFGPKVELFGCSCLSSNKHTTFAPGWSNHQK